MNIESLYAPIDIDASSIVGQHCVFGYPKEERLRTEQQKPGSALIGKPVAVGPDCLVGNQVVVHEGVQVGAGCVIEDRVRIGYDSTIGERTRIVYGATTGRIGLRRFTARSLRRCITGEKIGLRRFTASCRSR